MREVGLDNLLFRLQASASETTTCSSLNDKEPVIVSPVITVHTLRKMVECKTVSFLTGRTSILIP